MERATYVCPGLWVGDEALVQRLAERDNELAEVVDTAEAAAPIRAAGVTAFVPTLAVAEQVLLDAGVDHVEASFRISVVSGRPFDGDPRDSEAP
jgi:hypothetical protein